MSDVFIGISYSLAACGVLVLCIGAITFLREWLFLRNAIVTTGTITERRPGLNPEGGKIYIYDILFKTRSDEEQKISLKHRQEWEPGAEVSIGYRAHKPTQAMFKRSTLPALIIFTASGLVLLLVSLFCFFISNNLVAI
ncbi:MAG: hypothetical protein NVSMB44_45350 [Ktedonobacteraceae bacterium]